MIAYASHLAVAHLTKESVASMMTLAALALFSWWAVQKNWNKYWNHAKFMQGRLVRLSPLDLFLIGYNCTAVSTVFSSQSAAEPPLEWLEKRVRSVIRLNPWLAGRLFTDKDGCPSLWIPEHINDKKIAECFTHIEVGDVERSAASPPRTVTVKSGNKCLDRDEVLWKVTLMTQKGSTKCALVVSMCHALGDGCTFFNVLHMLSESAALQSLSPDRALFDVEAFLNQRRTSLRLECTLQVLWILVKICISKAQSICGKDLKVKHILIDKEMLNSHKELMTCEGAYVSSNDIVSSLLLNESKASVGRIAINLRSRVEKLHPHLAGNYILSMGLSPSDYASPLCIRRALNAKLENIKHCSLTDDRAPKRRAAVKNVKLFDEHLVTNWTSFYRTLYLPGYEMLHQKPIVLGNVEVSSIMDLSIIYRPMKDAIAVLKSFE